MAAYPGKSPAVPWGKTEHAISEWGFRNIFVAVTREVANTFLDTNASLETCL